MRDLLESLDKIEEASYEWREITQDQRLMKMMDRAKRVSDNGSTSAPLKIAQLIFEAYKLGLEDGQSEYE